VLLENDDMIYDFMSFARGGDFTKNCWWFTKGVC
jgi:hypothetical protein